MRILQKFIFIIWIYLTLFTFILIWKYTVDEYTHIEYSPTIHISILLINSCIVKTKLIISASFLAICIKWSCREINAFKRSSTFGPVASKSIKLAFRIFSWPQICKVIWRNRESLPLKIIIKNMLREYKMQ